MRDWEPIDDEEFDAELRKELEESEGLSDEEQQARLDAILDQFPPSKRLPPDLSELYRAIGACAALRKILGDKQPPYDLERFDAYDAMIGGMGLVIEAFDPLIERKVALKFWCQSGMLAQVALLNEARMLGQLNHPNVVQIYDVDWWKNRVFYVMEWIDGPDGAEWLKQPRTWAEIRDVFVDAGKGLAAAHDKHIMHRDFKPTNMLIGKDGRTVVVDFGVADVLREIDGADDPWGTPSGTPTFMAPERLRRRRGDARSDQFSFCVAMWWSLFKLRPYAGETAQEILAAVDGGELREVMGTGVPGWLTAVLRKGLAAEPKRRYASMHELVAALLAGPSGAEPEEDERSGASGGGELDGRMLNAPREELLRSSEGGATDVVVEARAVEDDERYARMTEFVEALLRAERDADARADRAGDGDALDRRMLDAPRERAPEEDAGAGAGGDDVHELGGPELHAPREGASRRLKWFGLASATLAVGVVLGGLGGWTLRAELPVRKAVELPAEPESPCAQVEGDASADLDPVVLEVCSLIRDGYLEAANLRWERQYFSQRVAGDPQETTTRGTYSLVVANTFVDQAGKLTDQDSSRSKMATAIAHTWTLRATTDLGPEHTGVQRVWARLDRVKATLPK